MVKMYIHFVVGLYITNIPIDNTILILYYIKYIYIYIYATDTIKCQKVPDAYLDVDTKRWRMMRREVITCNG